MRNLNKYLENKSINYTILEKYGFIKKDSNYTFSKKIINDEYLVVIEINKNNIISKIIELDFNEEFLPADTSSTGEYVGMIKEEYENVIKDFINKCTYNDAFKSKQSKEVIEYIKNKYQDELEFLWDKYDDAAIWRNKNNNKWYGLIMKIPKIKIGINSDDEVEIIDIMYQKEDIENIIDNKKIFKGYHMNKKSWITIKLDNSISNDKLFELIDNSYNLSENKRKK